MVRALIVEDEVLVAMLLEDLLQELGFDVQVCSTVADATVWARRAHFDFAILDVNLGMTLSYPVADVLIETSVPFAFATGYGRRGVDLRYAAIPVLDKPYDSQRLREVIEQLCISR